MNASPPKPYLVERSRYHEGRVHFRNLRSKDGRQFSCVGQLLVREYLGTGWVDIHFNEFAGACGINHSWCLSESDIPRLIDDGEGGYLLSGPRIDS